MAGQGRRLRHPGGGGGVRLRAARVADQRHRPAAGRGAGGSARAGGAAPLPSGGVRSRRVSRAEDIARALDRVRARVRAAERAAGRPEGGVRLLAVSKTMPAEDVAAALAAGQRDFGENYAQELRDKRGAVAALPGGAGARWHYIGPLQSNKVKYVAGKVAL